MPNSKRLFNEYEAWLPEATAFENRVWKVIDSEVNLLADAGYSLRDIESVLHGMVSGHMAEKILRAGIDRKCEERKASSVGERTCDGCGKVTPSLSRSRGDSWLCSDCIREAVAGRYFNHQIGAYVAGPLSEEF